jgi:predicted Rossmann-fold nucleotide-binding protein
MFARNGFNALHGGGDHGVMGQLTESATVYGTYVKGVTVHSSGAPKIYFERAAGDAHPHEIDLHIASKDMIHRMESYAGHSEAFVALDGGLGTIQEVLVLADLIARGHPVTRYQGADGQGHTKPLFLLNESGIYTPILNYLQNQPGCEHLLKVIQVVNSVAELEQGLVEHFRLHPPRSRTVAERQAFRDEYEQTPRPGTSLPPMPRLDGAFPPSPRDQDRGLDLRP